MRKIVGLPDAAWGAVAVPPGLAPSSMAVNTKPSLLVEVFDTTGALKVPRVEVLAADVLTVALVAPLPVNVDPLLLQDTELRPCSLAAFNSATTPLATFALVLPPAGTV